MRRGLAFPRKVRKIWANNAFNNVKEGESVMPRNKQSLAKRAATLALALCMVFTTAAQSLGAVAYADSTSMAVSSSMSVDPGVPESSPESESTPVDTETDDSASVPPAESNADSSSETDASSLPSESESNSDSGSSSSSQDADSTSQKSRKRFILSGRLLGARPSRMWWNGLTVPTKHFLTI